tara:strand:+ start:3986 stop:4264 length:279 start_codon:yes stop_codon:yes gene_type:complete
MSANELTPISEGSFISIIPSSSDNLPLSIRLDKQVDSKALLDTAKGTSSDARRCRHPAITLIGKTPGQMERVMRFEPDYRVLWNCLRAPNHE